MCLGKSRSISYLLKRNIWFKMFIDQRLENLSVNRPTLVSGGKDHGRRRIGIWIRRSTAACVLSCSPCHTILPGCAPVSGGNSYSAADVAWPSPPPQCVPGIYSHRSHLRHLTWDSTRRLRTDRSWPVSCVYAGWGSSVDRTGTPVRHTDRSRSHNWQRTGS